MSRPQPRADSCGRIVARRAWPAAEGLKASVMRDESALKHRLNLQNRHSSARPSVVRFSKSSINCSGWTTVGSDATFAPALISIVIWSNMLSRIPPRVQLRGGGPCCAPSWRLHPGKSCSDSSQHSLLRWPSSTAVCRTGLIWHLCVSACSAGWPSAS